MSVTPAAVQAAPSWTELQKLFPVRNYCAYLRNCAAAPISVPVADAMREYVRGYVDQGRYKDEALAEDVRAKAAQLLGASDDEIAFVQSTVTGINHVANGIDFREGDNVIGADIEFPANYYPWFNLRDKGVAVKLVPHRDGRIPTEDILSAIDGRTRVVALSHVQFTTGFRSDLRTIGKYCRERGVYFSVDAVQSLGALPVNVKEDYIDFLQAGAHKWLLGPMGQGIFYVRKEILDDLRVAFVGHHSMVERDDELPYEWDLQPSARRFEAGVHNFAGLYGLGAALDLIAEIGVSNIEQRLRELTDHAIAGLRERGCEIMTPLGEGERSGIVLFKSPRVESRALVHKLMDNQIITNPRMGGVRIGPHYYNSEDELDRLFTFV